MTNKDDKAENNRGVTECPLELWKVYSVGNEIFLLTEVIEVTDGSYQIYGYDLKEEYRKNEKGDIFYDQVTFLVQKYREIVYGKWRLPLWRGANFNHFKLVEYTPAELEGLMEKIKESFLKFVYDGGWEEILEEGLDEFINDMDEACQNYSNPPKPFNDEQ